MKRAITLACTILTVIIVSAQPKQPTYSDAFKLIEVWLKAQKDYKDVPSIMGAVIKDQKVLWSGAFGESNLEENLPSSTNTICSICSISKTFTAIAVMKLVDDGKIKLDDAIADILPDFTINQKFPDQDGISVRSLLAHSSGLPRDTGHSYWSAPDFPFPTKEALYAKLPNLETIAPVGEQHNYSNLGYALLGQVIEQVSGLSYSDYIGKTIFDPLQMSNSYVEIQDELHGNKHAIGYTARNRNGKRKCAPVFKTRALQPAAGISSSISDMAKYVSWQFRLMDSDSSEILQPSTLKSMYQVQTTSKNGRLKRGYGFEVFTDNQGSQWAMHGGICPGYVSYLKMDVTNKLAYVVLINANGERALRYVNGIKDILSKAELDSQKAIVDSSLEAYEGYYNLNPWNSEYYIGPWGDGLVAFYLPADSIPYSMYFYQRVHGDTFQLVGENGLLEDSLEFYRNGEGQVVRVKNEGNYHPRMDY